MSANKNFAADAAKAGLILGLVQFVFNAIPPILNLDITISSYVSWIGIVAMIVGIYYLGKKRADAKGDLGNTFGEAFGFTLVSMFYAGIIVGLGTYFLNVHIAPEYFEAQWALAAAQMGATFEASSTPMPDFLGNALDTGLELMQSPIAMVFGGIFNMMLNGGVLALFISPFLKRNVNIFVEKNEE